MIKDPTRSPLRLKEEIVDEKKIILVHEKTLEDILLETIDLTRNGCSYNFIIEGRDVYLVKGCRLLVLTREIRIMEKWFDDHAEDGRVLISKFVSPRIIAKLRDRVGDCPVCGGELVKKMKA